jgi:hypothetical protein
VGYRHLVLKGKRSIVGELRPVSLWNDLCRHFSPHRVLQSCQFSPAYKKHVVKKVTIKSIEDIYQEFYPAIWKRSTESSVIDASVYNFL